MVLRDHVIYLSHSAHGKCPVCVGRVPSAPACICGPFLCLTCQRTRENPDALVQKQCELTCNVLRRTSSPLELGGAAMVGLDRAEEPKEEGERNERLEWHRGSTFSLCALTRQTGTVKAERGSACRLKLYLPQINPRAAPVVHRHWDEAPIKRAWRDTGIKPSRAFHRREDTAWRDIKRLRNLLVWVCVWDKEEKWARVCVHAWES